MPLSGRLSYVCLRYTLPIDSLGVGFYGSLVFSASIVLGLNTKVDRAFVPGTLFRSGPPSPFAWVGFESGCIFEMGCETRGGRVSAIGGVIFQSLPPPPHFPTPVFSRERGGSSFGSRSNDLRGGDQSEEPDRPVGKGSDEKGHRPPQERKRGRHGLG